MPHQARVLLVDDREMVRETLRCILDDFDCSFEEAEDGETALRCMTTESFDVVYLDLRLPDISGLEVLRRVRSSGGFQGKVIILTGQPEEATRAEAKDLGVLRYLGKNPISWHEIREAFVTALPDAVERASKPRAAVPPVVSGTPQTLRHAGRPRKSAKAGAGLPRLLVLDDDPVWLETMDEALGTNFDLTLTTSAKEASRLSRRSRFDLVILDMQLPGGVSGLDVLGEVRRARPDLRAIILTAFPDPDSAFRSARAGAVRYISKGEPKELPDMIARLLQERERPIRVFLSYARADYSRVSYWFRRLLQEGFLPWMDTKSIVGGLQWEPEIEKAIRECDRFIFFVSRRSLERTGKLRKELNLALEHVREMLPRSVFLIPARLEDCRLDEQIQEFESVDLFKKEGAARLLRALNHHPPSQV